MRALGAELLILSNAGGGLNPQFASGDVVVIEDHIDLMCWRRTGKATGAGLCQKTRAGGWYDGLPGPSKREEVDMATASEGHRTGLPTKPCTVGGSFGSNGSPAGRPNGCPYDRQFVRQALAVARRDRFAAYRGVYVAMSGPNYETRAEYRFLRRIGGDVVGMSTVPEADAGIRCGMRTLALSTVTNVARPDAPQVVRPEDVIAAAQRAEPNIRAIVIDVVTRPWHPTRREP
jgi:purine-nucleoside phosphorylase